MKRFFWLSLVIATIGMVPLDAMEKKPVVVKGDLILLPEHLAVLSHEEQEIFNLTERNEYADRLGVAVQVTSAEREAKKGKRYLIDTYAAAILGKSKDKLSEEAQCNRILNVLGNWHTSIHPIIGARFPYRIPFNLITKRSFKKLMKDKSLGYIEIPSSDRQVLLKLFFVKDKYAYAGETSHSQIAKKLIKEYEQLIEKTLEDIEKQQIELDEQLAIALRDEEYQGNESEEEVPNEFPVV